VATRTLTDYDAAVVVDLNGDVPDGAQQCHAPRRDVCAEITYLTGALKASTLREAASRLAERARPENWSHEKCLIACLQGEVSARESAVVSAALALPAAGLKVVGRVRLHQTRGLKRNPTAHMGTQTSSPPGPSPGAVHSRAPQTPTPS
jgi:hypothetical protein